MKQATAVLLCLALLCACFAGCGQKQPPAEASASGSQESRPAPQEPTTAAAEAEIPGVEQPRIDWNTAFQTTELPAGELDVDSVAFLKQNEDGSKSVLTVPKAELRSKLPKQLPRTRYYEQFLDPAVTEELLPVLDYALFQDCCSMCVPSARLSGSLIGESGQLLSKTFFDAYSFSGQGVRKYPQPDGQEQVFLLVNIDNYREIRDKYRRLDGLNAAKAVVLELPEGLDEQEILFRFYRWLTQTVQYYPGQDPRRDYHEKHNSSLLFDAMLNHLTIDEGYAETLTVLCSLAGIECFTVSSGEHFWNIARIDGTYYHFDAACDRGRTPADFRCFGISDEAFRACHGAGVEPLPFYREYGPACRDELFPALLDGGTDGNSPAAAIAAYYQYRNDRNANPLFLFYLMQYSREGIGTEAPKDGWIRTLVDMEALTAFLGGVMTPAQCARFTAGRLEARTEGDARLSYRVPAEDPELTRLVGLEDNGDGSWTARLLRFRSPAAFTPVQETVTLVQTDGKWLVDGAE